MKKWFSSNCVLREALSKITFCSNGEGVGDVWSVGEGVGKIICIGTFQSTSCPAGVSEDCWFLVVVAHTTGL